MIERWSHQLEAKTKFHMAAVKSLHPWVTHKLPHPVDREIGCSWLIVLSFKFSPLMLVAVIDSGAWKPQLSQFSCSSRLLTVTMVSSLPCFLTSSAVTETSLIASQLRQHPINLLNKVCSLAVLFVENQGDHIDSWKWVSGAGCASLCQENQQYYKCNICCVDRWCWDLCEYYQHSLVPSDVSVGSLV